MYVPFRWIGEGIKANVVWDAPTKTVVIYQRKPIHPHPI
ncbi:stalk domain-containing protein [Paenibacillus borealis]